MAKHLSSSRSWETAFRDSTLREYLLSIRITGDAVSQPLANPIGGLRREIHRSDVGFGTNSATDESERARHEGFASIQRQAPATETATMPRHLPGTYAAAPAKEPRQIWTRTTVKFSGMVVPDESPIAEPSKIVVVAAKPSWSWRDCGKSRNARPDAAATAKALFGKDALTQTMLTETCRDGVLLPFPGPQFHPRPSPKTVN